MRTLKIIGTISVWAGLVFAFSPLIAAMIAETVSPGEGNGDVALAGIITLPIGGLIVVLGIIFRIIAQRKIASTAPETQKPVSHFFSLDFWAIIILLSPFILPVGLYFLDQLMNVLSKAL